MYIQPIQVAIAAQITQNKYMNIMLVTKFIHTAARTILSLSLTFHTQARILKLICSKKLKTRNRTEYCSITPEVKYFIQNRTYAIGREKVNKNILNASPIIKKLFVNILFTSVILSFSHLLCNSEKTGNNNPKIGPIIINGIDIMER